MSRHKNEPYTCPRCGYTTCKKPYMQRHFFSKKKECPGSASKIELTDDIKQEVLQNRIYHNPDENNQMQISINNFNIMNNFVANMDVVQKLQQLTQYKQLEVMDFESKVEDTYHRDIQRLESNSFKRDFMLKNSDFYDIVDTLTQVIRGRNRKTFIEFISFMYDNKKKRIKVYAGEKWEDYLVDKGLTYLVDTIASYYLEVYECYLIRKMTNIEHKSTYLYADFLKCLQDYYTFLACFDVDPYVKHKYDNQVLYNKDDAEYHQKPSKDDFQAYNVCERFHRVYTDIYDAVTNAGKKEIHKKVLDIIKVNSKENVKELDSEVVGLIRLDEEFKKNLMKNMGVVA
jgi:hypothetical protein